MIRLVVDGRDIEAVEGRSLLHVCLESGIYIPNLCFMESMSDPPASCRLCFVDVEGRNKPVASCRIEAKDGMVVRTDTPAVRKLQRTALRLLLSAHEADCRNCPSNRKCELQRMVRLLGVRLRPRRLPNLVAELPLVQEHPLFNILPSRCVLCGRCIQVCEERKGPSLLTFARRGFNSVISAFGQDHPAYDRCGECLACVEACPVSAIRLKEHDSVGCLDAS